MRAAPSYRARQTGTRPNVLARRLLARLGDRSVIHRIDIGRRPPKKERDFHPRRKLPKDAVWAYIDAAKASPLASWETELVAGALRDELCNAGGPALAGWSVSGQVAGMSTTEDAFNQRFPNPSPAKFRARVAAVGKLYDFRPVSIRLLRPRQLAPLVVLETDRDRKEFIADVAAIMKLLDPQSFSKHQVAMTFEGFFLEARDRRGPFVRVDDVYRGDVGGGQWSAERDAYPYPHG
jgi:hypothetical protein